MAKVYLTYMRSMDQQDPSGGNNEDEMYYRIEEGSTKNNIGSFDLYETIEPYTLLESDAATKSDPLFFTLWEDDPGSGDDPFEKISQLSSGDPGAIKDGGIYFDGTPGYYLFTFSGNGGQYALGFDVV